MPTLIENFEAGDLLYGTETDRAPFKKELRAKFPNFPLTIDDINNIMLVQVKGGRKAQWTIAKEAEFLADLKINPKYYSAGTFKGFLNLQKTVTRAKLRIQNNEFPINPKGISNDIRARIRACKAVLLDYHAKHNRTVHFILDEIELHHVINREYSLSTRKKSKDAKSIYDGYTNAELRFILKYYDQISDSKNAIKFYQNGNEIDLFDWIRKQPLEAKAALIQYAKTKILNSSTQEKIIAAAGGEDTLARVKETSTSFSSSSAQIFTLAEPENKILDKKKEVVEEENLTFRRLKPKEKEKNFLPEKVKMDLPDDIINRPHNPKIKKSS